jgi:hypothetical protein
MTPGIEAALESNFKLCDPDRKSIAVVQAADVTGDGVPEALVDYCHMGAYTSDLALIQLMGGKPALAHFQGTDGKPFTPGFLEGASVKNGEATKLLPEKHAVYVQTILENQRRVLSMPMSGPSKVAHLTRTELSAKR